jgi:pimeloyl-ACP methyl ester carboxylesterase
MFYSVAAVPLSVASGLGFAGLASVYAWYAWGGLAIGGLAVVRLMPRAVGARRLWTPLWALAAVAALGAGSRLGGGVTAVALVPVSAVLTILVLRRMRGPTRSGTAGVPVALVALLGLVPGPPAGPPIASETVLLLVPGVDTASGRGALYRFRPSELGIGCERVFYYSYLGPGRGAPSGEAACPIVQHAAYRKDDTQRPLQELADAFVRQVERIRRRAGDVPVAVVTHSQGAVIAWEAISSGRAGGISHLAMLGGFPHSPLGYPPPGADGEGRIGADALRILSAASRGLGSGTFSPDAPLAREILARPNGLEEVFAAPLPEGIAAASVATSFDLIVSPEGWRIPGVPGWMVDTTHVGVAEDERAYAAVGAFLRGHDPPERSLVAPLVDALVHAFMPPPAEAEGTG